MVEPTNREKEHTMTAFRYMPLNNTLASSAESYHHYEHKKAEERIQNCKLGLPSDYEFDSYIVRNISNQVRTYDSMQTVHAIMERRQSKVLEVYATFVNSKEKSFRKIEVSILYYNAQQNTCTLKGHETTFHTALNALQKELQQPVRAE